MARQSLQKVYADFRRGFVDIASPLQQPEGTVKDIVNFDIGTDGSLQKRSGLQESGTPLGGTTSQTNQAFLWKNVDNNINKTFVVIPQGDFVNVYDASFGGIDFADEYRVGTLFIPNIKVAPDSIYDFAPAMGKLFFAQSRKGVGYISYSEEDDKLSFKTFNLKFRDTTLWEGDNDIETGLEWSTEASASPQRFYNLRNSGWPEIVPYVITKENNVEAYHDADLDPIPFYKSKMGRWPKLSENFYVSRNGGGFGAADQLAFNPFNYTIDVGGTTIPPVGRFIKDVREFTREARGVSQTYRLSQMPSKIAFYAGRMWYAGDYDYDQEDLSARGNIYFSQDLRLNIDNAEKCYQENDPTAEDINQLLATDGGYLSIKQAGKVKGLVPMSTSLFVLTDKGIWRIVGQDFNSFTADSFSVDKVTDTGVLSENAYIVADNGIFFYTQEGLFVIGSEGDLGAVSYQNISDDVIKNFTQSLPEKSIENVKVTYNKKRSIVSCFFAIPKNGEDTSTFRYDLEYNTVLNFKIDTGAFYKYEFNLQGKYIRAAIDELYTQTFSVNDPFVDSVGDVYVDSNGDEYYLPVVTGYSENDVTLFILVYDEAAGELIPCTFSDTVKFEDLGTPYEAKVEIGYDNIGNLLSDKKQAPYLVSYLDNKFLNSWKIVPPPEPPQPPGGEVFPAVPEEYGITHPYRFTVMKGLWYLPEGTVTTYYDQDAQELPPLFSNEKLVPTFTPNLKHMYSAVEETPGVFKLKICDLEGAGRPVSDILTFGNNYSSFAYGIQVSKDSKYIVVHSPQYNEFYIYNTETKSLYTGTDKYNNAVVGRDYGIFFNQSNSQLDVVRLSDGAVVYAEYGVSILDLGDRKSSLSGRYMAYSIPGYNTIALFDFDQSESPIVTDSLLGRYKNFTFVGDDLLFAKNLDKEVSTPTNSIGFDVFDMNLNRVEEFTENGNFDIPDIELPRNTVHLIKTEESTGATQVGIWIDYVYDPDTQAWTRTESTNTAAWDSGSFSARPAVTTVDGSLMFSTVEDFSVGNVPYIIFPDGSLSAFLNLFRGVRTFGSSNYARRFAIEGGASGFNILDHGGNTMFSITEDDTYSYDLA